jgi:hypothetical protein
LIGFQAILLLLQQNQKYKAVNILVYLPYLDTAERQNGKSCHVSGSSMEHFQVAI